MLLLVPFSYKIILNEHTELNTGGGGKMKQINFIFESEKQLEEKIKVENFVEKNLLVFLFSDEPIEKIKMIIGILKKFTFGFSSWNLFCRYNK